MAALAAGALFGAGLVVSGMTRPDKVIGFLDPFGGRWDPSLALVMASAIAVHTIVYHRVRRRPSPLLVSSWSLPSRRDVDGKLLLGAALFGVGWGLGGYCPGPGVVSLAGGAASSIVFVGVMLATMALTARVETWLSTRERASAVTTGSRASLPGLGPPSTDAAPQRSS
jgi:uncharacterized protein